jgi:flagellar biosynthesis/type III secretory pathway protein FliH
MFTLAHHAGVTMANKQKKQKDAMNRRIRAEGFKSGYKSGYEAGQRDIKEAFRVLMDLERSGAASRA